MEHVATLDIFKKDGKKWTLVNHYEGDADVMPTLVSSLARKAFKWGGAMTRLVDEGPDYGNESRKITAYFDNGYKYAYNVRI